MKAAVGLRRLSMLPYSFFDRPAETVAQDLVGKVIRRRLDGQWLSAAIVETEAYGGDKASHSYLGRTPSREAMFDRWAWRASTTSAR